MENKDIVRIARAILGMKQKQLAREIGVTIVTISKWENGVSRVPQKRLEYFEGVILSFVNNYMSNK